METNKSENNKEEYFFIQLCKTGLELWLCYTVEAKHWANITGNKESKTINTPNSYRLRILEAT